MEQVCVLINDRNLAANIIEGKVAEVASPDLYSSFIWIVKT